jgi:hypothetical protein
MSLFSKASSGSGFPALDDLPWRDRPHEALTGARGLLTAKDLTDDLAAWLTTRPSGELAQILDRSLERTTHFKWFLGAGPSAYVVWLHEYKPPELFDQATGFAASVHNHRYGFCSCVLRGGLDVSAFRTPRYPGDPVRLMGRRRIGPGETMTLSHEDVHRIDQVEPQTCTILIQGPPARNFSTCYDPRSGHGRRLYDMESRLPQTLALLADGRVT